MLPDYNSSSNTVTHGNGVRLKSVSKFNFDLSTAKTTKFFYEGGKALRKIGPLIRGFSYNGVSPVWGTGVLDIIYQIKDYSVAINVGNIGTNFSNALSSAGNVGYDKTIQQEIDLNGIPNGKTEFEFVNIPDEEPPISTQELSPNLPSTKKLLYNLIPNHANGTINSVSIFKSVGTNFKLVKKITNTYTSILSSLDYGVKFSGFDTKIIGKMCSEFHPVFGNIIGGWPNFHYFPRALASYYPIYDSRTLLTESTVSEYPENSNRPLTSTTEYFHNLYGIVNFKRTKSPTGEYVKEFTEHAEDYFINTGNNALLQKNILTEVTKVKIEKAKADYWTLIGVPLEYKNEYATNGTNVIKTKTIANNKPDVSNSLPSTIIYKNYDEKGNLLEYIEKDVSKSILWGYNNNLVVAEINNASSKNVAYTSFEELVINNNSIIEDVGNWSIYPAAIQANNAVTGAKAYDLTNKPIQSGSLNMSNAYTVSYWSISGAKNVNNTPFVTGKTVNGWRYYEHTVNNASNITVTGTGFIDELRLYPTSAQITTYTYEPLIGITSICDNNSKIIYYEYDVFNQLKFIRDQDKNIIKAFEFNIKK